MDERRKTTILVLDDEPIVLKRLRPALEKAGYEVEVFSRSSEAMARVMDKNFDIVITDLKMPGHDGDGEGIFSNGRVRFPRKAFQAG
jgi:CheY-like chemotaxis protein